MIPLLGRSLPRCTDLTEAQRRTLAAAVALLGVVIAALSVESVAVWCGARPLRWLILWSPVGIYALATFIVAFRAYSLKAQRLPWSLFALGVASYGIGTVVYVALYSNRAVPEVPCLADPFWVAFYPLVVLAALAFCGSGRGTRPGLRVLLDSLVAGAGLASLGGAAILPHVLSATHTTGWARATMLAYPLGDLVLCGLVVGIIGLRGWRLERVWTWMGCGALALTAGGCLFTFQFSGGGVQVAVAANLMTAVAFALFAVSAWQRSPLMPPPSSTRWAVFLVPSGFSIAAIGLLVYNRLDRVSGLVFWLTVLTSLAAVARMVAAFGDARQLFEARRLAQTDDLTALPNRRAFVAAVEHALSCAAVLDGRVAVLMLDLDNFKQLNDTLGHQSGDRLLALIGPRLRALLEPTQLLARLGGDEFALLLDPAPGDDAVAMLAEEILSALRAPFDVHGISLRVAGSVGIATASSACGDVEELMRHADIAMYQAKRTRTGYEFYDCARDTHSTERLGLPARLGAALDEGQIEVWFQPKVAMSSPQVVGMEALVRWRQPDGSLLMPEAFIAVAEHAGLSRQLTRYVIDRSLAQIRSWRDSGHPVHVAVNTTVSDLLDSRFPGDVRAALMRHRLPPSSLVLEITETALMTDPERINEVLDQLGALGVELSLDDFGTGYSSLAHLKTLPVGEIKIDRSFVSRMTTDDTDAAIVSATVMLGQRLGVRVVAEGVEDQACWDALADLGCDVVQGYLISRPVPAHQLDELTGWVRRRAIEAAAVAGALAADSRRLSQL